MLMTFAVALAATACDTDDTLGLPSPAPACVQEVIDVASRVDKDVLWYILAQEVGGEVHYLLDWGAPAFDGGRVIVDGACDTVCTIGGRGVAPACRADYDPEGWVVVWKG